MGRSRNSSWATPPAASRTMAFRPAMRQPMGTLLCQKASQCRVSLRTPRMQRPEALPVRPFAQASAAWRLLSLLR